ncbi:polysaccharide deacetylase family protein [Actinomadura rupiterrae]|uniref:polysaccharide deacetylase family protein n=1 Tax=Actinomadura rupiterrae TaxID=559627 RepID=UPI0020A5E8C5|nr:polysaccharide deacetylase family protein [Actinomadura rupiterrae]MCP2336469.1 peptidoglycan/xylan/chitin deacetylase (PgdA/CDA1 family) [Actinomadura rupiterrae]
MPLPIRSSNPSRQGAQPPGVQPPDMQPPGAPSSDELGRPPGEGMPRLGRPSKGLNRRKVLFGGLAAAGLTAVTAFAADELMSGGSAKGQEHTAGHAAGTSGRHHPPTAAPRTAPPASWTSSPLQSARTPLFDLRELQPPPPPTAVALTIDDGPHPVYTPMMLDLLAEHGIKATFSLIGSQVKMFPKVVERIAAAGHQISNHSQTHPSPFAAIGQDRIRREIMEAKERIENAAGYSPKFFRSPGGDWNQFIFEQCRSQGMMPIAWNIDPRDWSRPGTEHIRRSMLGAKGGDVLLCHDGGGDRRETIEALRTVLPALKQRGLTFVAL